MPPSQKTKRENNNMTNSIKTLKNKQIKVTFKIIYVFVSGVLVCSSFCNKTQAYLAATVRLVPGHCKKANAAKEQVVLRFWFPSAL